MQPTLAFDEVHVISDLHLGGREGFQIFGLTPELTGLIQYVRDRTPERSLGLVINGDFVDFLAEEPARHFDPLEAGRKLAGILGPQGTFAPIGAALRDFLKRNHRTLIVNVGNHDLELAIPWVREELCRILSGDDAVCRSRLYVVSDGTGVLCRVGDASVLCVHGNEVDEWNVADYETIRRIARDITQGMPVKPWIPNAGTQLVIDVMNSVKASYPFVDLLKPEVKAVVPTLLALDYRLLAKVPQAIPIELRRRWDRLRMATGLLGEEERASGSAADRWTDSRHADDTAPPLTRQRRERENREYANALLDRAEQRLERGDDPLYVVSRDGPDEFLGGGAALRRLAKGDVVDALREALEGLQKDRSFECDERDATFTALDERIGSEIDFLVAGHTHLARALPRRVGRGFYFNTGTWARLVKLKPEVLQNRAKFASVFAVFKEGDMAALDAAEGLVDRIPTFASIWAEGGRARGELRRYRPGTDEPYDILKKSSS